MEIDVGRRVFRRRPWLNFVPMASAVDVRSDESPRLTEARWYAFSFLTVTVSVTVPCRLREPGVGWVFP